MTRQHGSPGAAPAGRARAVATIASIKWHLLVGGLRGSTQQRLQTLVAVGVSLLLGVLGLAMLAVTGASSSSADDVIVVLLPVVVGGVALLSAAAGVESTLDARHLATEPLTRSTLGAGLLLAAAVGPPSLLALLCGVGIVLGWSDGLGWAAAVSTVAVIAWWATLLLASRTLANTLGALATGRFRQFAQAAATLAALVAWLVTQLIARDTSGWGAQRWSSMADIARWTPPGQLGVAIAEAQDPSAALLPLALGVSWLPLLLWTSVLSAERLARSSPRVTSGRSLRRGRGSGEGLLDRVLPSGAAGAIARRTVRTKLRTPRQAVNTVTALAIGAGVFFLGPIFGGEVDPRIVVVGGLLHFAVLFDGNNSFGMDGPPMWIEVAAGADATVLVRGKVLSSLVVMALPALVLPLGLAALSGGWAWLGAGWLVAIGSVLGAAGVAVASAALAPVAMPESANPLAAGDTGQGCIAGLMLAVCMLVLGLTSLPVAAAIYVASESSPTAATLVASVAPVAGALVLWGGTTVARSRLAGAEERLVQKVTPAR